ncbi:EAL and HDOD domain-containing protein [Trichlorobacter lovleyi]|uniref:Diguanylate phosphodiesterase n=2 Tax=Trichlorobacter lovleyi TaxID=313985 RepID=B3E1R8_TRIL1|nr:HDOD domain-containing protein [Trichlorobacter lovleyi]ACD95568.1 diguanylate phosphodiesterase [Trichlorobacter lovleyi SZ]
MESNSHLMGRQPILNGLEEVVGYELLFRSPKSIATATIECPVQATSRVMLDVISSFGIREMLGDLPGYINVDAEMLLSDAIQLLPSDVIGLELLEDVVITPAIVARCRDLKAQGYQLVLDDHRYGPQYEELYDGLVDIIKMDMITTPLDDQYREVELFKRYPVKLLAEKVDSRHVYLRCRKMGFELFQGYFFARPSLVKKARLANSSSTFFQLMQQLSRDADINEIEQTFKQSPALTYKLLLLVNSVSFSIREKIRTVRHAIMQVGRQHLKRWVQLAIFADDGGLGVHNPLLEMAAVRAAFMEELARLELSKTRLLRYAQPDECFMLGTLSVLKDVCEIGTDDMRKNLNLSDDLVGALVAHEGDLGTMLCLAEMIEQLEFEEAEQCLGRLGVSPDLVLDCQKKAYSWRNSLV